MALNIHDPVDALAQRTIRALSKLQPMQRDVVVERILRTDPQLEPVVRTFVAVTRVRHLGALRRDSVS